MTGLFVRVANGDSNVNATLQYCHGSRAHCEGQDRFHVGSYWFGFILIQKEVAAEQKFLYMFFQELIQDHFCSVAALQSTQENVQFPRERRIAERQSENVHLAQMRLADAMTTSSGRNKGFSTTLSWPTVKNPDEEVHTQDSR